MAARRKTRLLVQIACKGSKPLGKTSRQCLLMDHAHDRYHVHGISVQLVQGKDCRRGGIGDGSRTNALSDRTSQTLLTRCKRTVLHCSAGKRLAYRQRAIVQNDTSDCSYARSHLEIHSVARFQQMLKSSTSSATFIARRMPMKSDVHARCLPCRKVSLSNSC